MKGPLAGPFFMPWTHITAGIVRSGCISAGDLVVSSLSRGTAGPGCLKWLHRTQSLTGSHQMITAFFAFTTVAFFCAIVVNVAATVAGSGQAA